MFTQKNSGLQVIMDIGSELIYFFHNTNLEMLSEVLIIFIYDSSHVIAKLV